MALTRPATIAAPAGPALPFGLLSVATLPPVAEPARWAGDGVTWRAANCAPPQPLPSGLCDPPDGAQIVDPTYDVDSNGLAVAYPFTVFGYDKCEAMAPQAEAEERAERHLLLGESMAIEQAIETGLDGNVEPNFTQGVDATVSTAVPIAEGIGLLEEVLGLNPGAGQGVLHMSRWAATMADAAGVTLDNRNGTLTTRLGTPVAAGGGYTGAITIGAVTPATGEQWVYATGKPVVYRTPPRMRGNDVANIDYLTNDRLVEYERDVLVGWSCGTWAVLVSVTGA